MLRTPVVNWPRWWLCVLGLHAALGLGTLGIGHAVHVAVAADHPGAHDGPDRSCWLCNHFQFNASYVAAVGPEPMAPQPARLVWCAAAATPFAGAAPVASARSPPRSS